MVEDPEYKVRREKQECVVCYYLPRIGGAMITTAECPLCGVKIHSGSTNIDLLCANCAKVHRLCKHCGADIELKQRRKF